MCRERAVQTPKTIVILITFPELHTRAAWVCNQPLRLQAAFPDTSMKPWKNKNPSSKDSRKARKATHTCLSKKNFIRALSMMMLGGGVLSGTHRMLSVFPPSLALSLSLSLLFSPSLAFSLSVTLFLPIEWTHSVSLLRSFWFPPCWRQSERPRCSRIQLDIQSSLENTDTLWSSWLEYHDQPMRSGGWYLHWPKVKIKMFTKYVMIFF